MSHAQHGRCKIPPDDGIRHRDPARRGLRAGSTFAMNEETTTRDIPLPDDWRVEYVSAPAASPINDLPAAVHAALDRPLGALSLVHLADAHARVCIAVDAIDEPQRSALDVVLDALLTAGVPAASITALVAPPGFAPHTLPIAQQIHDFTDRRLVDDLGRCEGVPLSVNHNAVDADLLIGISALHLDDPLRSSGSQRFVAHDMSGVETHNELNDTRFLDEMFTPWAGADRLYDRIVREGARRAGLVFVVDLLLDECGRPLAVKAGTPTLVDAELGLIAHTLREAAATRPADLLVADVGPVGLYSAVRAPIHLSMTPDAALVRGGIVVLPDLHRDVAHNAAEIDEIDAFYDALDIGADSEEVIRHLRGRSLGPGESRAYLLAHALQQHPIIAVSADGARTARHLIPARDITEAAELAETLLGRRPHTLVLSRALSSLPVASRFAQPESADDLLDGLLDDLDL
jgi:hypothetical protein